MKKYTLKTSLIFMDRKIVCTYGIQSDKLTIKDLSTNKTRVKKVLDFLNKNAVEEYLVLKHLDDIMIHLYRI